MSFFDGDVIKGTRYKVKAKHSKVKVKTLGFKAKAEA